MTLNPRKSKGGAVVEDDQMFSYIGKNIIIRGKDVGCGY